MSTITYRHEYNISYIKNNIKYVIKEMLSDGEYLSFKYLYKTDQEFYMIYVEEDKNNKENYSCRITRNRDTTTEFIKTLNELEKKIIKPNPKLKFVSDYLKSKNITSSKKSSKKVAIRSMKIKSSKTKK